MKKENLGSVKALKKQLGAAVAMVCVAAVALGSSTYAWFVSNNTVDATVSSISAQSNAAFLTINNGMFPIIRLHLKQAPLWRKPMDLCFRLLN